MTITKEMQKKYIEYLKEMERSPRTIEKYTHDIQRFSEFVGDMDFTKAVVLCFKENLRKKMSPVSANSILAAVNSFLKFLELPQFCVKAFKIQRRLFSLKSELTEGEYKRLVKAAFKNGNERLALIIQTICATGIRVSELRYISVEAVKIGKSEVSCKGSLESFSFPKSSVKYF